MPNWCNNHIEIRGDEKQVRELWERAQKVGLLQALYPIPAELEDTTAPHDTPNWYDWRLSYWGTKWDVDLSELEYGVESVYDHEGKATTEAYIVGQFDSAWSPPDMAIENYVDSFERIEDAPTISLYYHEPGMTYVGQNFNGLEDYYLDYSSLSIEELTEELPAHLEERFMIIENLEEWEREDEEGENE